MRWPFWKLSLDRSGTTSLEFAIVGSAFILLVIFIFEASLLLWARGAIQMTASQTARCIAISSSACTDRQAYATSLLGTWGVSGIIPLINVGPPLDTTCGSTAGHFISVTISSAGSGSAGFISPLSAVVLTASACYPTGV